jgi:hypothetical protein
MFLIFSFALLLLLLSPGRALERDELGLCGTLFSRLLQVLKLLISFSYFFSSLRI